MAVFDLALKLRRGDTPFWRRARTLARGVLHCHVPVVSPTRPLFRLLYGVHVLGREGLIWARRFFWYEPLFRSQCVHVGRGFQMEQLPYLTGQGQIVIGDDVRLSGKPSFGFSNRLRPDPVIEIGDDTFIGHGCSFHAAESIRIGRHCLLAAGVRVHDFDGHPLDAVARRAKQPTPPEGVRPVRIGDDVWIGAGAMILKGVTIGARSVVGAGAVVSKDVPPDVVVAGNPARVVKHLTGPTHA
jgi:acetyltransferase-like isoleucine patch superfamily enzyme